MKKIAVLAALFVLAGAAFAQTGVKYFVAHQGGYIGEATVVISPTGNITSASIAEWQGPGSWAENNSADGKSIVDGAVVRAPDPFANATNADPEIKGYMFYVCSQPVAGGPSLWIQYAPGKDGFAKSTNYTRDFEGLMCNPIRAEAYVKAAKADTLVNVKIEGLKVVVGKKASETVHYGNMNKTNPAATYMPIGAATIGYRYNAKALIEFFMANPTADYSTAKLVKKAVKIAADKKIDVADAAAYTAAEDSVYAVADAVSGATYSDFQHYAMELQTAYQKALAMAWMPFAK
ncbi:MAG: hypothetical protein Q8M76_16750 [Spirochaetaceae bacterium]|nr:hypothetical protein [Spirochaetaceae bacterium]